MTGIGKKISSVVRWIKEKITESGARGGVVGLSGGVDSAVVAALVKKAAGGNHLCLAMPCGSSIRDMKDAASVAGKFHLKFRVVDISRIYEVFIKTLSAVDIDSGTRSHRRGFPHDGYGLSEANLKPRIRMATLYYFANRLNYLVVGTGNKSELSVGYFTKYGDGGVDILPLGGFYKSEVVAMAEYLGVPRSVIEKPPSAGLWDGQTDEGEMGITYDDLEKILRAVCRDGNSGYVGLGNFPSGIDGLLVKKVVDMYNRSAHKRALPEIFRP